MKLDFIRPLNVEAPLASGRSFLSAASGMVRFGNRIFVVADDDVHLATFNGSDAGRLIGLLPDALPHDAKARKKAKPDFEILLALDGNRLLALGSGSTERRMRGVIVDVYKPSPTILLDLTPLIAAISMLVPEVNLEGGVIDGDRLLLFNRGNMAAPATQVIETSVVATLSGSAAKVRLARELDFPDIQGVPLTATDACQLEDGCFLLSAVAEATDNSYADGALAGAGVVLLDHELNVIAVEFVEPSVKIEGIVAKRVEDGIEFFCVTDADDPVQPAGLYRALWRT
ncbi:hypothetical protein DXH95_01670 [Sphingorhabdus pulchriflava]|uniref:Uncharacterized protein n=1 Tax=Sphingorhabdus pulchriflava TaxID=2292257 RepID=A0A371BF00_9SPHN|nr:hypothetical protein [Sphingorhabdus pulchriflava]RDV06172.1 hypothetical protein DXH95_01670 [Sphingorhabdus pulchriflava]